MLVDINVSTSRGSKPIGRFETDTGVYSKWVRTKGQNGDHGHRLWRITGPNGEGGGAWTIDLRIFEWAETNGLTVKTLVIDAIDEGCVYSASVEDFKRYGERTKEERWGGQSALWVGHWLKRCAPRATMTSTEFYAMVETHDSGPKTAQLSML